MNKYISPTTPGLEVTAAQYITELVCLNINKAPLPSNFWKDPEWKRQYQGQIVAANKLLKDFDPKAIIKAIKGDKRTISLRPKFFRYKCEKEQKKIDALPKEEKIVINEESNMRKPFKRKGLIDDL